MIAPAFSADLVHDLERGAAADHAVDPVVLGRDRALDHADVLAGVRLHRGLERVLGLAARGGHQRLVVVERDEVEDQLREVGVRRAQQRLGAAGALLEVQPDHRRLEPGRGGLHHPRRGGGAEADRGRRHRDRP